MMGRNHLLSHTATAAIATNTAFYFGQYQGRFADIIQPLGQKPLAWFASAVTDMPYGLGYGLAAVLFMVGSLLPDVDSPNSMLGRKFHLPIGHRTWTHSVWFFVPLVVASIFLPILSYLTVGYGLHLFMDAFSRCGVAFFYPFSKYLTYPSGAMVKKNHHLKLYRTKHWTELLTVAVLVIGAIGFSYWMWSNRLYPFL